MTNLTNSTNTTNLTKEIETMNNESNTTNTFEAVYEERAINLLSRPKLTVYDLISDFMVQYMENDGPLTTFNWELILETGKLPSALRDHEIEAHLPTVRFFSGVKEDIDFGTIDSLTGLRKIIQSNRTTLLDTNLSIETNMTNTTNQEAINMNEVNKSALVSTMTADLFHAGLTPMESLLVATSFIGAAEYMDDGEMFAEVFGDGLCNATIEVVKNPVDAPLVDLAKFEAALIQAQYLNDDGDMGDKLEELLLQRKEAYELPLASEGITRRFNYSQVKHSNLAVEAIHALESTNVTVDEDMLSVALQVQAKLGGEEADQEAYVIRGCQKMDAGLAYVSEFKADRRGRIYQASCFGPNGQASDRSRALMNLHGVPTDYDVDAVYKVILAEIYDMAKDVTKAAKDRRDLGDVEFIVQEIAKGDAANVSKPWSFVKAAKILADIKAGGRPYIGMAVGLDAKCSGPQLGALMVADVRLAAACGFTLEQLDDAYHLAIVELEKAGFYGLVRADVKKPYMGIFYGQGWMAFTKRDEVNDACWASLYPNGTVNDDRAQAFHKAITASFGNKMRAVRQAIKDMGEKSKGRTKHMMPDGFEVAMNYKVKVNALNEVMGYDTAKYDVVVRNNMESFKFINFQLNTLDVHEGDFARNGFVNMIQATDALIARLIIVNLKRLGAQHIISVHDCFRVNATEMHLLEKAIKAAYTELFGSLTNTKSKDLPYGQDIIGLYFQGANKQLEGSWEPTHMSQFTSSGKRYMRAVNGHSVQELIDSLGVSYYFAK